MVESTSLSASSRPPQLVDLPSELLRVVASHLEIIDLLALAEVCLRLHTSANDELIWQGLLRHHHSAVLRTLFDDEVPLPCDAHSWKEHFFLFDRSWKGLASRKTGRLLLRLATTAAEPHRELFWKPQNDTCVQSCSTNLHQGRTYGIYDVSVARLEQIRPECTNTHISSLLMATASLAGHGLCAPPPRNRAAPARGVRGV